MNISTKSTKTGNAFVSFSFEVRKPICRITLPAFAEKDKRKKNTFMRPSHIDFYTLEEARKFMNRSIPKDWLVEMLLAQSKEK